MKRKRAVAISPWNGLTLREAEKLVERRDAGEFDLENLRGHVKHVIGMCTDQLDHSKIARELWRMTSEITILQGFRWNRRRKEMELNQIRKSSSG